MFVVVGCKIGTPLSTTPNQLSADGGVWAGQAKRARLPLCRSTHLGWLESVGAGMDLLIWLPGPAHDSLAQMPLPSPAELVMETEEEHDGGSVLGMPMLERSAESWALTRSGSEASADLWFGLANSGEDAPPPMLWLGPERSDFAAFEHPLVGKHRCSCIRDSWR